MPPRASACPGCGADENTGWNERATGLDGLDLPDPDFDYDEFLKREFSRPTIKPAGVKWIWWLTAVALLGLMLAGWILSLSP